MSKYCDGVMSVQPAPEPVNSVDEPTPVSPKKLRTRTPAVKPAADKPPAVERPRAATAPKQPAAAKQPSKPSSSGRSVGRPPSASVATVKTPAVTATSSLRNAAPSAAVSNSADDGKKVPRYSAFAVELQYHLCGVSV